MAGHQCRITLFCLALIIWFVILLELMSSTPQERWASIQLMLSMSVLRERTILENHFNPKELPVGIGNDSAGGFNVSHASFCGNTTPTIQRFGLVDVLGNDVEGLLYNITSEDTMLNAEGDDLGLETGPLPPDAFNSTMLLLIFFYISVPVLMTLVVLFAFWRYYKMWRQERDAMFNNAPLRYLPLDLDNRHRE